jgi:hypothetical protein
MTIIKMTTHLVKPPQKPESKETPTNTQKELDALKKSLIENEKFPEVLAAQKFNAIYNSIR